MLIFSSPGTFPYPASPPQALASTFHASRVLVRPTSRPSSFLENYPRVFPDPPVPDLNVRPANPDRRQPFSQQRRKSKRFPLSCLVFLASSSVQHQSQADISTNSLTPEPVATTFTVPTVQIFA
jgi:hypothetical protein